MLTDDKKKRIESLTTDEMLFEINLGHRSRFQKEKFAYLKTCYQLRLSEENKKLAGEQSMTYDKAKANTKEIHDRPIILSSKPISKIDKWHETMLGKVTVGVIIAIISYCIVWIVNHYLSLGL